MNTCKDCKWWKQLEVQDNFLPDYVASIRDREITTRICHNPRLERDTDSRGHITNHSNAFPNASDDHCICFVTGCDFGCIHWEAK